MNDIDILEEYIKHDTDLVNLPEYDAKIVYKAILNLKENLKIANKKIAAQRGQLMMLNKAYIPKSKVEEKIEELKNKMNEDEPDEFGIHSVSWGCLDYVVEFLQSLLGKE